MKALLTHARMPEGSSAENPPIVASSTHFNISPEYVESVKELASAVWPQTGNRGGLARNDYHIADRTSWIRNNGYLPPVRQPSETESACVDRQTGSLLIDLTAIKDDATGELYVVWSNDARLWRLLEDYSEKTIALSLGLGISEDGSLFIWPYVTWAMGPAINEAMGGWVRVLFKESSEGYRVVARPGEVRSVWPFVKDEEVIAMAFGSRVISSLDHPLVKKLGTQMSKSFVPSFIPLIPSQIPYTLMSGSEHNGKISRFLGDQIAEELTDWIRDHGYIIPVREPADAEIVRTTSAGDSVRRPMATVTDEDTGEMHMVSPNVIFKTKAKFEHLYGSRSFALTISINGSMFLWPVTTESLRNAIKNSENQWVRVCSGRSSEYHILDLPQSDFPEPIWPDLDLKDIITMGFHSRVIESLEHPLIRRLHGNVIPFPSAPSTAS